MTYSHRNGEMEPPTEAGWYWFSGYIHGYQAGNNRRGLVRVTRGKMMGDGFDILMVWPTWDEGGDAISECLARWWGPLTPPWEETP